MISYSSDLNAFSIGVIVLGIGSGIYHPVGTSGITKYTTNTAKSLGYHSLGGAIGIALAPWFFINISSNYSWEASYLIFGLLTLPIILIYFDKEIINLKKDFNILLNYGQIVYWPPFSHMDCHYDFTIENKDVFTSICYLNDDFEGGRTLLEDKKIEPEVGKVIVFISNKMKHGVEEVRGGRFTYISWWRNSNDF